MRINKILALVVSLVISVTILGTIPVSANTSKDSDLDVFIHNVLKDFLIVEGYDENSDIAISSYFPVYNFENGEITPNKRIYFIFYDDSVVGKLSIDIANNEYQANYSIISNSILDELYQKKISFAYGYYGDISAVLFENELKPINSNAKIQYESFYDDLTLKNVTKEQKFSLEKQTRSSLLYNKQLSNVSFVYNVSNPDNGEGLCWAATMAMKINRETTVVIDRVTARDVYQQAKNVGISEDLPYGCIFWYKVTYPSYFVYIDEYINGGLTYNQITTALNKNKTIHVDLLYGSGGWGHSVLFTGISIYNDYSLYTIYDSNGYKCYQYVSQEAMNDPSKFYYSTDYNRTYYNWTNSIY